MVSRATHAVVSLLPPGDLLAVAQCIVIDAEAFPFASVQFGQRSAGAPLWVARSGQNPRVLGFVATQVRRRDIEIEALAVARDVRHHGLGRALLSTVLGYAYTEGLETVSLHVWAGNAHALAMYRSEGFIVLRTLEGYYRPGTFDATGDAYEMVRQIER
jgi:ribosomal protein S18 acetylase RimI-like enzyme